MTYTVVGARGFIGGAFVRALRSRGAAVLEVSHEEAVTVAGDLGDVIYASGVAWNANEQVGAAVRAHVDVPVIMLRKPLRSFTYVSSTRVYGDCAATAETTPARIAAGDVYAATKAAGEAVVLSDERHAMRVVRLSNVYGASFRSALMLSDFLRQAATTGQIEVRSSVDSEKDHVSVEDAVEMTLQIAERGRERIYNVAAGRNTRQGDILDAIERASGCHISVAPDAPVVAFSSIDVSRLRSEFDFSARDVIADIPQLWRAFRAHFARAGATP